MVVKSEGSTPTERLLADLCERSFLKLWSYPNPFKEDGQELCDLLAVFENHVFIFSDRESRKLDATDKDIGVLWERWKRNVIDDQIRTANGAEKYLRSGRKIFLDPKLTAPFPLNIDPKNMVVHKIIVAHGAMEACKNFSPDNISGSLAITYSEKPSGMNVPFMLELNKNDLVHVFDTHNLGIILGELDTIFDFSTYLKEKVRAISAVDVFNYCGEEDLLANYWFQFDEKTKLHYIGPKEAGYNMVHIPEGEWEALRKHKSYLAKKEADRISYVWDDLLQRTCQNALDGRLGGNGNVLEGKSAIHEMAKEPRFMRRELSERIMHAIKDFPDNLGNGFMRKITAFPSFYPNKRYLLLQIKVDEIKDYENQHRPMRQALLEVACAAMKNENPHLDIIVGIAMDAPKYAETNSEDFLLMDCSDWPEERRRHYEELNRDLGFFKTDKLKRHEKTIREFPHDESKQSKENV